MKTIEEVKIEVAKEFNYGLGEGFRIDLFINECMRRYAQEALKEAAEKATITSLTDREDTTIIIVDKDSILNIELK